MTRPLEAAGEQTFTLSAPRLMSFGLSIELHRQVGLCVRELVHGTGVLITRAQVTQLQ